MNNVKNKFLFLLIILLCSCSFGLGGNVWNDLSDEIERAKERKNSKIIFSTQKRLTEEILESRLNGYSLKEVKILDLSNAKLKDFDDIFTSKNFRS